MVGDFNITMITAKQSKAMQLIREGNNSTSAMRSAGYSDQTSQAPGRNLLRSVAAMSIVEQYKEEYLSLGITSIYIVKKTKEWLEAKNSTGQPDYRTQLKAAEFVRRDFGLDNTNNVNSKK